MTRRTLRSSLRPARFGMLSTLLLVTLGACTTQVVERPAPNSPSGDFAAIAPQLSVERFLTAVNARDYESMAALFGTYDGPVEREWRELELQMATLAEILRHSDYRIVSERREPGRQHSTQRIGVTLTIGERTFPDVPFLVVQSRSGGWLIEEIDVEAVTNGR